MQCSQHTIVSAARARSSHRQNPPNSWKSEETFSNFYQKPILPTESAFLQTLMKEYQLWTSHERYYLKGDKAVLTKETLIYSRQTLKSCFHLEMRPVFLQGLKIMLDVCVNQRKFIFSVCCFRILLQTQRNLTFLYPFKGRLSK